MSNVITQEKSEAVDDSHSEQEQIAKDDLGHVIGGASIDKLYRVQEVDRHSDFLQFDLDRGQQHNTLLDGFEREPVSRDADARFGDLGYINPEDIMDSVSVSAPGGIVTWTKDY